MHNLILSALKESPKDFEAIGPYLTEITCDRGRVLYEPGDTFETVYFPHDCGVSMLVVLSNGEAIEANTIGREGGLGFGVVGGAKQALMRSVIQVRGRLAKLDAARFRAAAEGSELLRSLVWRHEEALYGYAAQSVACNVTHEVEARFCRWVLTCRDRTDSDVLELTQEFLAQMLGVQRTTVTAVARSLAAQGAIQNRRGAIQIVDRALLENRACECRRSVQAMYARLLPETAGED